MGRKYFFGRETVFSDGYKVDALSGIELDDTCEIEVKVAFGRKPLEAVRHLFGITFYQIFELFLDQSAEFKRILNYILCKKNEDSIIAVALLDRKNYHVDRGFTYRGNMVIFVFEDITPGVSGEALNIVSNQVRTGITSMLTTGEIPEDMDRLLSIDKNNKIYCMFNYKTFKTDSIEPCLIEINEQRRKTPIPLYAIMQDDNPPSDPFFTEDNCTYCHVTKLLVQIFCLLRHYYEKDDYIHTLVTHPVNIHLLLKDLIDRGTDYIHNLAKSAVHTKRRDIDEFCNNNIKLQLFIQSEFYGNRTYSSYSSAIQEYSAVLSQLNHMDIIPSKSQWVSQEKGQTIIEGRIRNWDRKVIVPKNMHKSIFVFCDDGELSRFTWIRDNNTVEKEAIIGISEGEYYLGLARIKNKALRQTAVGVVLEMIEIFSPFPVQSIAYKLIGNKSFIITKCPWCSVERLRIWICETCRFLVREWSKTEVACLCGRTKWEYIQLFCYGCSTIENSSFQWKSQDNLPDNVKEDMTRLQDYGVTNTQDQYIGKGSNPEESNDYEIARQLQEEYDNNPNVEYSILERQQSHLDQSKSSEHPVNSKSEIGAESLKNPSSTKSEKILSKNKTSVKGSDMAKRFSFLQDRRESNPESETQNTELPEGSSQKQDDTNNLTDFKIDNQNDQSAVKDNVPDDSLVANEKTSNKLYPNLSSSLPLSTSTTNDDNYQHTNQNSAPSDSQAADHRDKKDTPAIYSSQMSEEPNAHILTNTDLDEIDKYNDQSNISPLQSQKTTVLINHNNVINEYELKDITPHKVKTDFNIQYGILELASDEIVSKEESDNQFEPPLVPGTYTLIVQKNTMIRINYKDLEREFDVNDVSPSKIKLAFEIKSGEIDLSSEEMSCKEKSESEFEPLLVPGAYRLTVRGPKEFTVIFLGESGVGKSTLISGLGNYLNWPTFEEAKKNQMQICIPVEFKVQRKLEQGGFDETTVRAGDFEDNENFNDVGQSVTQKPKVHEFTFQNNTVKVIDTPGLSDTRGAEQDKKNLELIRECIHNQKEIHAICIVLKSNESKLGNQFELAIRDLLSLFPKSALKNVFFFFTYARGTYFGIGDILNPLKELQQKFRDSHGVTFEFEGRNMCPVDSESFRYLLCKERGIKYSSSAEERFEYCWNETAKQMLDFLAFLKSVDSVDVEEIKAAHEIAKTALELEEFLRTDKALKKGLSERAVELLKKRGEPLFCIARSLTMVPEYYRLKTEKVEFDSTEIKKSIEELLPVVKSSNVLHDGLLKLTDNLKVWRKHGEMNTGTSVVNGTNR